MRLNGWQRIGLALSVLWVLGSAGWLWYQENDLALYQAGEEKRWCISIHADLTACATPFDEYHRAAVKDFWEWIPYLALIPVVVAWVFGYVVAWIRAGFTARKA
jgi:hypothetical protein